MEKIRPPLLKPGDRIGIVSPARFVSPDEIEGAIDWIREMGFVPVPGRHVYDRHRQFAGSDKDRAADIRDFFEDPEISCIWATRGGYGCIRLLPFLEGVDPAASPKWLIGYSDLTVLHAWLNEKFKIQTIHGPMLFSWDNSEETRESFNALGRVLTEGAIEYEYDIHPLNTAMGMEGALAGGNLSMILSMRGTSMDLDVKDKILLIEDVDEYLYHIDRIMQNFRNSGWMDQLSGFLVGGMTGMNDNNVPFGQKAEEIISEISINTNIPVVFGHPAGHIKRNMPLILGENIKISQVNGKMKSNQ